MSCDWPFGTDSGDYPGKQVLGKQVAVVYKRRDQYGCVVGKVLVNRLNANLLPLVTGLAWHYKAFADAIGVHPEAPVHTRDVTPQQARSAA